MHAPAVVGWLLVVLSGAAGLCCLALGCASVRGRACPRRGKGRGGSHAAEALMGFGMAGMALPAAQGHPVPSPFWAALFGGVAVGFAVAALRPSAAAHRGHRLHHAVGAASMAYLAAAMTAVGPAGHAGHAALSGGPALLTGLLLLYFGGYALWAGSRVVTVQGAAAGAGGRPWHTSGLPQACRLVMGLGMFAMLLTG